MKTNKQGDVGGQPAGEAADFPTTAAAQSNVAKVKDVIASDEHAGKGGSYVINPDTGKRHLSMEMVAGRAEAALAEKKRAASKAAELGDE
ncbi:hypothetical protein HHL21_14515 [Massilia sp. RP-1-19]|uniref:Uncharacterized protein n=1 Tax=Massilia polaris TaxID=2728846 RepID=A0A848HMN6_9BURK|nr:hypothetical protein [Massilia polaris]NML62267.1 hypothetical protein [Massilia polaris]